MVFVTLFTRLKNVHLLKDVGMIPYLLHRDYGYHSIMATRKNETSYPSLKQEVKGLSIRFIRGKGALYLIRNAKKIDVLNVYHLNLQSFFNLLIFRLLKKKSAKSYLKLDIDDRGLKRLLQPGAVGFIKRRTIDLADLVSAETKRIRKKLHDIYGEKILYIPNGYYAEEQDTEEAFHKNNVILTVGELGTEAKATEVLIRAFVKAAEDRKDWKLQLVGPVAEGFRNPYPEDARITFEGKITDRNRLNRIYREAKIFAFPSRHESFGIAMLEAASAGDYIVSTKGVPAARDIIEVTGEGKIVPVDDTEALSMVFRKLMNSDRDWDGKARDIARKTSDHFRWEKIIPGLEERLGQI